MNVKETIDSVAEHMIDLYMEALLDKKITQEQYDEWSDSVRLWAKERANELLPTRHH